MALDIDLLYTRTLTYLLLLQPVVLVKRPRLEPRTGYYSALVAFLVHSRGVQRHNLEVHHKHFLPNPL
jgi:hypothetical protein